MTLVAGVDSSTQSCKVLIIDADTGRLVRSGTAPHPPGTEVDPQAWWVALLAAIADAGGLADVAALSVGGQQHGMIVLDANGEVIRPALLWNDTRSSVAAEQLVEEFGDGDLALGAARWADAVGSVPVASFTVTKLRWLADHEPDNAARIAAVALPHDWLTWRLTGASTLETLVTDRSDASGTGYFDPSEGVYRWDLLALALRRPTEEVTGIRLPRVLGPAEAAGRGSTTLGLNHLLLGPGCGDNAGAALGLGLAPGATQVSLGTSGVVATVSETPVRDATGTVAGFADATGHFLPLVCTLNGARVLVSTAELLSVDYDEFSRLALSAPAGADGLTLVPYFEGERTPNLPHATATLSGMTLTSFTRANLARAAVEGLARLLGDALTGVRERDVPVRRVTLVGGGAQAEAFRVVAAQVWGLPVDVPPPAEYVARGAARQAAWVLSGAASPPHWAEAGVTTYEP
ncbi:MAG: xylulokinase [Actinomycetales bacterium]|jgi:xylulokinase|uniref:Xylulose kinase n=1 Tax=Candidatus Phosphoribacter hodrii TaxID=2953743 RepID=A0A935M7P3_9MICO|nr:xylulokinase [Candidatus Phosphoribacter hodrii]HBX80874.1 xylulokinase [Propionibacteriaceae bacterium]HBY24740.1 xylulokinase [Propionibacteriaceae bacterium]